MLSKNYLLFQIALGNTHSTKVEITDTEWICFFELCKKQALVGIGFSALEKLHLQGIKCPKEIIFKWYSMVLQVEKKNVLLNEQCKKLTEQYGHDGISTCILKGQGNLLNYPKELRTRRQCGDIDVWAIQTDGRQQETTYCPQADEGFSIAVQTGKNEVEYNGRKAVIEYVKMLHRSAGTSDRPVIRYHHIEAPKMEGTEVEVHFRVGYINSPLKNRRMQRWFDEHAEVCMKNNTHMGFSVPTSSVNVIYQMCHLFSHYFDEGLGLRQLMDYYFALQVWQKEFADSKDLQSQGMCGEGLASLVMSKVEVMSVLRSFGMAKFTAAVMYVLYEVFAMPTHYYLCEPNKKEGRRLLAEIMQGGNFGQYDTRDAALKKGGMMKHGVWKLKRVMRLVSSYPEEALWEPVFRVYHLFWRILHK